MALHLNLNHELERRRALKRRDPLKLSIFGLAAIAAGFAGYYFLQLGKMHVINQELTKVKAQFDALEPQAKTAKQHDEELSAKIKTSDLLVKKIEDRFYWAPLLEQLIQLVPREVQVTKLAGDLTGESLRKCSVTLDGLSAGPDPRRVAEDLRTAIVEKFSPQFKSVSANFKSLEDGIELVMLDGQHVPTATFAINFLLSTGEEPAPLPPPRTKK